MASSSTHLTPDASDGIQPVTDSTGGPSNHADSKMSGKGKATASKPKRRFVGKNSMASNTVQSSSSRSIPHSSIPPDILQDPLLADAIARNLPKNYEFEVYKTIWNIRKWDCKTVALQMPEGLLMWGCVLSDIVER